MTVNAIKENGKKEEMILQDPSTSHWLKLQIRESRQRDILDALNDAEQLVYLLKERLKEFPELSETR